MTADAGTLHQAARRYLTDRYNELVRSYEDLPHPRSADGYSARARRIFPRYQVVQAILTEVERLDPDRLPEPPVVAAALRRAADVAASPLPEPLGDIEAEVTADERARFASAIDGWVDDPELRVRPLGYRRVLTPEESADWRRRLEERWGVRDLRWHPMLADEPPPDVLILDEASMHTRRGATAVRRALRDLRGRRVVELREHGPDHLVDVDMFTPAYTGAEGVWTDDGLAWVAYASHEGTVAFGGTLADALGDR